MEPTNAPSAPITAASLAEEASRNAPEEAAALLGVHPPEMMAQALAHLSPVVAQDLIAALPSEARELAFAAAPEVLSRQWQRNAMYESGSVGRMLEPVAAEFAPSRTVRETVEDLRERVRNTLVTYCFVVDEHEHLLGLITMRDLLFADPDRRLDEVMTKSVFALHTSTPLEEAMKSVLERHYPVYPVVDADGRLRGQVRGQSMFEARAFDITAQAGSMVGVEKEERIASPWKQSLKLRHPWLQLNLLTAFLAAGVVGYFQDTVDRLVILAVFLPVLAGQSGNTGCQALAVTLRGMTLGELQAGSERTLISKEARLGLLNGAGVGLIAAIGMFVIAKSQGSTHAFALAMVVFLAMIGSCVASGLSGALVPLTMKRFGLDPATASSIFLTTATDVVSMGMLLGLATLLVV